MGHRELDIRPREACDLAVAHSAGERQQVAGAALNWNVLAREDTFRIG
jgi:hypothetical protein